MVLQHGRNSTFKIVIMSAMEYIPFKAHNIIKVTNSYYNDGNEFIL